MEESDSDEESDTMLLSDVPDSLHRLMPAVATNLCSITETSWSMIALATSTAWMAKLAQEGTSKVDESTCAEVSDQNKKNLCAKRCVETDSVITFICLTCRLQRSHRS